MDLPPSCPPNNQPLGNTPATKDTEQDSLEVRGSHAREEQGGHSHLGPQPGGCADGLRKGLLAQAFRPNACFRLPRWLLLQGTLATAVLFVLGDTQDPTLPAQRARVDSVTESSLTSIYGGPGTGRASCTRTQHCPLPRQPGDSGWHCQSSGQGRPGAGSLPLSPAHLRLEQGSQAGQGQVAQDPSEGSPVHLGFRLARGLGEWTHCGVRTRVLGDHRGWAPKQVHMVAPPPTSHGMVKSMSP